MRAAIMARVSTENQKDNTSQDTQVAECLEFAKSEGYTVDECDIYREGCISGGRLDRPLLDKVRDLVEQGVYQAVVWHKPSRLAREPAHCYLIQDEFKRVGTRVLYLSNPDYDKTPQGEMFLGFQFSFDKYEKYVIADRFRRGRMARLRAGETTPGGRPLYGYSKEGKKRGSKWVINEETAEVVRNIFDWFIGGLSTGKIVGRLLQLGIPRPSGKGYKWDRTAVTKILKNEGYTGEWYFNRVTRVPCKTKRINGHTKGFRTTNSIRDREDWILLTIPTIIDKETFAKAQDRFEQVRNHNPRNKRYSYLLSGLIKCGSCGRNYVGFAAYWRNRPGAVLYYCCNGRRERHDCVAPYVRLDQLEPIVWDGLKNIMGSPYVITEAIQQKARLGDNEKSRLKGNIETLRQIMHKLEQKRTQNLDLYCNGVIGMDEVKVRTAGVEKEKKDVEGELAKLQARLARFDVNRKVIAMVERVAQNALEKMDKMTIEEKRKLLEDLGVQIRITGTDVLLMGVFGETEVRGSVGESDVVAVSHTSCIRFSDNHKTLPFVKVLSLRRTA